MNAFWSFQRMVAIVTIHCMGLTYYGFSRLFGLFVRDRERRLERTQRTQGRVLRWIYRTLGATFIKVGQVLSTRPDLLSPATTDELKQLQDAIPPFDFKHVRATIEADLGGRLEDHFATFAELPVAAASVAQVHRAMLPNGTEVAVKVLRPNVRRRVALDGRIMVACARLLEWMVPSSRLSEPVAHTEHIFESIVGQTDLTQELNHYKAFRENFQNAPNVLFPEVYPQLSSPRILTMEFCHGEKIDQVNESRYPTIAPMIRRVFLKMCFEDGFLHADLHPGNFLITEDNRMAIFDVGLVCEITGQTLEHFVDFAKCISMGTAEDLVHHIRTFHSYLHNVDWDAVTTEAEAIVSTLRETPTAELEWGPFIGEVLSLCRRHRMRPLPEIVMVMVGVITAEGIGKQIDPNSNTFDDIARFILPILIRRNMLPVGGIPSAV